mgnify:CR=1 FL=1
MAQRTTSFFRKLNKLRDEIYAKRDKEAAEMYNSVVAFVLGCSYTKKKKAEYHVRLMLEGYSYAVIGERLGISEASAREYAKEYSDILYGIFGKDFFDRMSDFKNNKSYMDKLLFVASKSSIGTDANSWKYVPRFINEYVLANSKEKDSHFTDINDCLKEMNFIIRNSIPAVESELKGLDPNKLRYVLNVFDGLEGNTQDKYYLMKSVLDTK